MTLPLSGPMSIDMVADVLDIPLSVVNLDNIEIRALGDKNTPLSQISFSDFYGKGSQTIFRVTRNPYYDPMNPVMLTNPSELYSLSGYKAAGYPSNQGSGQKGSISYNLYRGIEIVTLAIGDIILILAPLNDVILFSLKGAKSSLDFKTLTIRSVVNPTVVKTVSSSVGMSTEFVPAAGAVPAHTRFRWPFGNQALAYFFTEPTFDVIITW